jgi:hypothetical protein
MQLPIVVPAPVVSEHAQSFRHLFPDFSPQFSKLSYKPCQISFPGEGQKNSLSF